MHYAPAEREDDIVTLRKRQVVQKGDGSLAKDIFLAVCAVLALYGIVFQLMYGLYGTGSDWLGLVLLTPALLYLGSSLIRKTHESYQILLYKREQHRQDLRTLAIIKELVEAPNDPVFQMTLYIATQINDLRSQFIWLAKAVTLFDTKRANALKTALNELSEDLHTRNALFELLKMHIRAPSLEDWFEALNNEIRAEPSRIIRLLSESKSKVVESLFLRILDFSDSKVRIEAINGLRSHYSEAIVSHLLHAARNEPDKKVENYFRYYFYLNREAIRSSEKNLAVFNLAIDQWWDQSYPHEHSKGIIAALLPSLPVKDRSQHFPIMLELLSPANSNTMDQSILEVLESNLVPRPASWIQRHHLMKIREVFRRNPNREHAFRSFQQIIAHGALVGFIQVQIDPSLN